MADLLMASFSIAYLCILWMLFVIPLFLFGRKTTRWELRPDIRWTTLRLRIKVVRFALFSILGILIGLASAGVQILTGTTRADYATTIGLLILLPAVSALIVITRRRIPWLKSLLWMALETAGCACFFTATLEHVYIATRSYEFESPDFLQTVLLFGTLSFVCGSVALFFLQRKPLPKKPGPYCPDCAYCLIGTPRHTCPECGRPFTLEELGVTETDLLPPTILPSQPTLPA